MIYEDLVEIFEGPVEPIILFDADDGFDWSALPHWGKSWHPMFLPTGVSLPMGLLSGPEDKRWLYPYSEIQLIAYHGLTIERVEGGDLVGVTKTKVYNLDPNRRGQTATSKIRDQFRILRSGPSSMEVGGKITLWLAMLAKGDLSFIVVGDPLMVPFVSLKFVPSGLLLTQEDGTIALVNRNADIYMV